MFIVSSDLMLIKAHSVKIQLCSRGHQLSSFKISFSLMLKQSPNSSRGMAQMSSLEEFFESMASEDNRKKLK